jgi:hypothetical protein
MKGTIKDLRMAEDLAGKGRYADALKVVDRMMGVPAQATGTQKVAAIRTAILSNEPLFDDPEIVDRPDGKSEFTLNLLRLRLPGEWSGELLIQRTRWLVAYLDAARSQEVLGLSLQDMSVISELLRDPTVQERIKPDDQATLLAMACDPFFVINDHETVEILLKSASYRAPANASVLQVARSLVQKLRSGVQSNTPNALANREKYRDGLTRLEPVLMMAEIAAEVVGNGVPPDAETLKAKVVERLAGSAPAAPTAPAPTPSDQPKKAGFWGRLFGKS